MKSTFEFYILDGEIRLIYNSEDHRLEELLKNEIQYPQVYSELKQIADYIYSEYSEFIDWQNWHVYPSGEDWSKMLAYFIRTHFADKDMLLDAIIEDGQVEINLEPTNEQAHKLVTDRVNKRCLEIA